ncbi:MAG: rhodanese-like domain-containing protein [Phycisphaerales bacterium]
MVRSPFDTARSRWFRVRRPSGFALGRSVSGFLTLALLAAVLLPACAGSVSDKSVTRIDAAAATRAANGRAAFVDVRPVEEFAAGHIPGALNIRLTDIPEERPHPELRSKGRIIVYGQNPGTAVATAFAKRLISSRQYGTVELFEGGFDAWRASGGPVERGN